MPSLRLFVAIDTPEPVKSQIHQIQSKLKESGAEVRWEPREKLHATLKFLGSVEGGVLPEIVYYLEGVLARFAGLEIRYSGLGCFPNTRDPRVIWVGMQDLKGNLEPLQRSIEDALVPLGFEKEDRKFHAHVTLGRVKGRRNIRSLLDRMESLTLESPPVTIGEILLVRSDLKPSGSVYTTVQTFPFHA